MTETVELPFWVVVVTVLFAALWLLQHFLLPSARWFFRRRANALIEEVNRKLALQIPSFKITRREVLIDRLIYHERVITLVDNLASSKDIPREALMQDVRSYAREIVPAFNALIYFKAAYWLARRLVHALYRVRLGFAHDTGLSEIDAQSSVVFVMNHRSNMDYILATYLAAERTALSYAVGEWARVWPLQQLIRSMGGYFVRRDSGDPLYRRVLECYVQMAAEGGVPQAVFPEGRLSRDGKLGTAKLGLLGYLVRGFDRQASRDIVFVPVGINYDRVFEDRTLLRYSQKLPKRGLAYTLSKSFSFFVKNLWQALLGKRYRYGYACVNFGEPLYLKKWLEERSGDQQNTLEDVTELADDLMLRIGGIIPILPVALVATVFVRNPTVSYTEFELKKEVFDLLGKLERSGIPAYIPRSDRDYAVSVGLRMLTLRKLLLETEGEYRQNPAELAMMNYYAHSIEHLIDRALVTFREDD
ncbi:MAG: 1-acyl-sn-glycerol-3-phosphate acyltransferase [Gammaproteobacteria bacterium]|nr:1-acyl-sn-glycerol-3-phosphate acyltransferase [Gammaproteobacteria bacterium]